MCLQHAYQRRYHRQKPRESSPSPAFGFAITHSRNEQPPDFFFPKGSATCYRRTDSRLGEEQNVLLHRFSLERLDDKQCLLRFRFLKRDIYRELDLWMWPVTRDVTKRRRYRTNSVESFCILTRRLATVSRWSDLEVEFGRHAAALSEIFYETLEFFFYTFGYLVTEFRGPFLHNRAELYSNAIMNAGAPLSRCVAFIDGTNIYIAKPRGRAQRATYNGHKRRNCLKFQALSLPDGLIFHLFGPEEGRRHYMTLFRHSNIEENLSTSLVIADNQYYIYGDPAYVMRPNLQIGFKGASLTDSQKTYNKKMSAVRVSVEWAFKDLKKCFTRVDFPRKLCLKHTPAALLYHAVALLWNFRACLYGSESAKFFGCDAPTLEIYLNGDEQAA